MTELQEKAMRMALKALLEAIKKIVPGGINSDTRALMQESIKALDRALAQSEQEPVAGKGKEFSEQLKLCARNVAFAASGHVDMSSAAMQEMFALIDHVCVGLDSPPAHQAENQELVEKNMTLACPSYLHGYTAPPKREWVGLTDEDKQEACGHMEKVKGGFWEFANYLDAKLKEKNT